MNAFQLYSKRLAVKVRAANVDRVARVALLRQPWVVNVSALHEGFAVSTPTHRRKRPEMCAQYFRSTRAK